MGRSLCSKLWHGRPLIFLRSRDDLAATTPKPINNNQANRGTNPAAGFGRGGCRSCGMGKLNTLRFFAVHLAQSMQQAWAREAADIPA